MTESLTYKNAQQRREDVKLPSRRKHTIMALASVSVLAAIPFLSTQFFGDARDAQSFGSVVVEPIKEIVALAPLDDEALPTPDIFAAELGAGQNPTDGLAPNVPARDALGNLIGGSSNLQTQTLPQVQTAASLDQASGQNFPSQNSPSQSSSGPKTILIDGNAVGPSSLPSAPLAGLTRSNQYGSAPTKGPNGKTPLNSYNRPFSNTSGKKPVSIIIGGLGVNSGVTQQAIDNLPPDITLSFAAHTAGLQSWINRARAAGHEVMVEVPMDSLGFDPSEAGADRALRTANTAEVNLRHMDWILSRGQGYFGVINYNGDNFLTRADLSAPILEKLSESGLGFISDGAFSAPSLSALSRSVKLPYKNAFGLIDPEPNPQVIRQQLSTLSSLAQSGAQPVGVGFAYTETIDTVARWIADLERQNLILAPASHNLVK